MADSLVNVGTIKNRYPTVYSRSNKKTVDSLINQLILEGYDRFSSYQYSSDYDRIIRLYVVSELQKEIDRSSREIGTTGLETSRSVPGEYSISYANPSSNASSFDSNKNEYEIELDRILNQFTVPFILQ